MFAFIRQEVARSTSTTTPPKSRTSPSQEGSSSAPGGGSTNKEDQTDGAGAELLEKREVVLSELPRLMELNKVSMSAHRGWGSGPPIHPSIHRVKLPPPPPLVGVAMFENTLAGGGMHRLIFPVLEVAGEGCSMKPSRSVGPRGRRSCFPSGERATIRPPCQLRHAAHRVLA